MKTKKDLEKEKFLEYLKAVIDFIENNEIKFDTGDLKLEWSAQTKMLMDHIDETRTKYAPSGTLIHRLAITATFRTEAS